MKEVMLVGETGQVVVPEWVVDLESFRRWVDAEDFPEDVRIGYINGLVYVDMTREQLFTHNAVKHEIGFALTGLIKARDLGHFFADGALFSNEEADLSGNPDGLFASHEALNAGRVRLLEGMEEGYLELEGSPDMVLEVVSRSSVRKDTVRLRKAYWGAGITEYWLVDARKESLSLEILRHTTKGYVASRKNEGWVKSTVFGKSFRLTVSENAHGRPVYTLAVR